MSKELVRELRDMQHVAEASGRVVTMTGATVKRIADEHEALESRLTRTREWMHHKRGCAGVSPNAPFDTSALPCDCGLDAFLSESGGFVEGV